MLNAFRQSEELNCHTPIISSPLPNAQRLSAIRGIKLEFSGDYSNALFYAQRLSAIRGIKHYGGSIAIGIVLMLNAFRQSEELN
ncbi:MAG: hypothetical protein HLUCCO16_08740 [Phormidium sp. OSCR]|nr:MAG: hypothetical protein HLUCCO16_08740 [Phormidium sp. OSCR]